MQRFFAGQAVLVALFSLTSCGKPSSVDKLTHDCSDKQAVKCSVLSRVTSPLHDFEVVTKIDSYGGGFGTGYDSADVYISRVETKADTLLFSIEDNADDITAKNLKVSWTSPKQLTIRYGHGDVTFQVVRFAGKTVTALHDTILDQGVR